MPTKWFPPRTPRAPRWIDCGVAAVLCLLAVYHFTQPDAAWRSGSIELASAILLLAAAFRLPALFSAAINLLGAAGLCALGIRHASHGGGYLSGSLELLAAVLLVIAAYSFWKSRKQL